MRVQVEPVQDQQMTRKAVRLSLAHACGVIGAVGHHVPKLVIMGKSHELEEKVELRVQVETVQDQHETIKDVIPAAQVNTNLFVTSKKRNREFKVLQNVF